MKAIISILAVIFLATSCEEQMINIPPAQLPVEGRVVLMEELTGVSCPPCAAAAIQIKNLAADSDGSVIYYGVHGSFQSEPTSTSIYDFRNEDAAEFESNYIVFGKPSAAINRMEFDDGNRVIGPSTWQGFIDDELQKPAVMSIAASTEYDSNTRQVSIFVGVTALVDMPGTSQLNVVISESKLIDPQKSNTETIPEFEHSHVMKSSLTKLAGDAFTDGMTQGELINRPYTYTIPEELNGEWIPENMEATIFVTSDEDNGQIQHAIQIDLVED